MATYELGPKGLSWHSPVEAQRKQSRRTEEVPSWYTSLPSLMSHQWVPASLSRREQQSRDLLVPLTICTYSSPEDEHRFTQLAQLWKRALNVTSGPFQISDSSSPMLWHHEVSQPEFHSWGSELKGGRRPRLQLSLWQTTKCLSNIHSSSFYQFWGCLFWGCSGKDLFPGLSWS